jgi:hypothetical protein
MDNLGYEQTLPVLTRPSAAAWSVADPIHPDHVPTYPIHSTAQIEQPSAPQAPSHPDPPAPTVPASGPSRNAPSKVRKRKNANASAGKSTLFWVNSDQQTAAEGTKEETLKRIRSHVMSEHNRKKRIESTKQYNKSKWKHSPYEPATDTGALVPSGSTPALITPPASLANSRISDEQDLDVEEILPTTAIGYPGLSATAWDDTSFDGTMVYPYGPSAWSYLGQGANDPFNTGHTQLTDRMMRHLRVCKCSRDLRMDGLPADAVIVLWDLTQEAHPLQTRYKPKLQAHWASLIQRDPAILHATICMATSNDAMRAGELPIRDPNQKRSQLVIDTFHHRGETIRLVNEGLSDPVKASSDVLIAAVSTLLTIEVGTFKLTCNYGCVSGMDPLARRKQMPMPNILSSHGRMVLWINSVFVPVPLLTMIADCLG